MVTKHFPESHKLHKIFHCNTVQVSYNCMNNMSKIIKGHHKKVISKPSEQQPKCNWRKKLGCPMKGNCQVNILELKRENGRTVSIASSYYLNKRDIPIIQHFQVTYGT